MKQYINNVNWISVIALLLATTMLQLILQQLYLGNFTIVGFSSNLQQIIQSNKAPEVWNQFLMLLSHYSVVSLTVIFLLMLLTTIGLFFSSNPVYAFVMAMIFASFWISNLGRSSSWIFEFLFPSLFALVVSIAQWDIKNHFKKSNQQLGYKILPSHKKLVMILAVLIIFVIFYYFNYLSKNGGEHRLAVSLLFSIFSSLAIFISLYLDRLRPALQTEVVDFINNRYLVIMGSIIGLMLVYQVNADISLHWFTSEGYKNLVETYQKTSNAPEVVKSFLALSASMSSILAPIQFIFETLAAFCLFLGIFRIPMYWLTTGLLGLLMIIEFGVPAQWPPTPQSPVNWLWELMLPTSVLLICSVHASAQFFCTQSHRERWLGTQLFSELSLSTKTLVISLLIVIFGIAFAQSTASHIVGTVLSTTLLFSILLFLIIIIIDPMKAKSRPTQTI
ncbi:hypothetical protein ACGP04_05880 [Piscirickettsia salmonis]|uniref:hypothetical protein n=1 Tax=Piscirickettsia salmonis TaxID=1238 RepID=UPI003750B413